MFCSSLWRNLFVRTVPTFWGSGTWRLGFVSATTGEREWKRESCFRWNIKDKHSSSFLSLTFSSSSSSLFIFFFSFSFNLFSDRCTPVYMPVVLSFSFYFFPFLGCGCRRGWPNRASTPPPYVPTASMSQINVPVLIMFYLQTFQFYLPFFLFLYSTYYFLGSSLSVICFICYIFFLSTCTPCVLYWLLFS